MARKNRNARDRITPKKLKKEGISYNIPDKPYRRKGDIYPGEIVAEAWPKVMKL